MAFRQVSIPAVEVCKFVSLTARGDWFGEPLITPDSIELRTGRAKPRVDLASIPNPRPLARTVSKGQDPPTADGAFKRLGRPPPVMHRLALPAQTKFQGHQGRVRLDPIRRGNRIDFSRAQGS